MCVSEVNNPDLYYLVSFIAVNLFKQQIWFTLSKCCKVYIRNKCYRCTEEKLITSTISERVAELNEYSSDG